MPEPDPRPIAVTRCWDCGAGPDDDPNGDPHGWSCELVPVEMFREWVANRPPRFPDLEER